MKSRFSNSLTVLVLVGVAVPAGWVESCCCRLECRKKQVESVSAKNPEKDADSHASPKKSSCCHKKKKTSLITESGIPAGASKLARGSCRCEKSPPWYWIPTFKRTKPKLSGDEREIAVIDNSMMTTQKSQDLTRLSKGGSNIENSPAHIAHCVWRL